MPQFIKPSGKLFDLSEVKKCPITLSEEARAYINASHEQGRMLPQALSEHFGALEHVESIALDVVSMQSVAPFHSNSEALALVITVKKYNDSNTYAFTLNAQDLRDLHPVTNQPLVQARRMAEHLKNQYPHNAIGTREVEEEVR